MLMIVYIFEIFSRGGFVVGGSVVSSGTLTKGHQEHEQLHIMEQTVKKGYILMQ